MPHHSTATSTDSSEPRNPTDELRDELNLILRAADDSADFQTAEVIGRAANRAFALVDQLEGRKEGAAKFIAPRAA
jgi:nitrogen-specific signal transduction histidine kinase